MRDRALGMALVLTLVACAQTQPSSDPRSSAASEASSDAYHGKADLPPGRRPPPSAPYSSDTVLLTERVAEAISLYDRDRWEHFVDAMDTGELVSDLHVSQDSIDRNEWKKEWLFQNGDDLFEHEIGAGEGFGPGRSRVHRKGLGGPDATACAECHHRGGLNGAGDLSENTFFDGDGVHPESAFERNPPAVLGLGIEQRLAEEMTATLQRERENVVANALSTGRDQSTVIEAKGIRFGRLTAHPDGTLDNSLLEGVDPDLSVKPFGWKGNFENLRQFVIGGFQAHFGIQAASRKDAPGAGPAWDRDQDGLPDEVSDGMITAVVVYLTRLEVPVIIPPRDPALLLRHARGFRLFQETGCASCHVPSLPLLDPRLQISKGLVGDVLAEGEAPRPRHDVYGPGINGTAIFLFSDLKRHAMGKALADGRVTTGVTLYDPASHETKTTSIAADVFLTRPLWGLADTAPYLHDGRARTLDEAILAHSGEAAGASKRFEALDRNGRADLRIFLLSLTRYPRIDYR